MAGGAAIGKGSVEGAANATTSAVVGSMTYSGFAGTAPASVVSVGTVGAERQVTNVAAGRITSSSTDAINGSQLYAVTDILGNKIDKVGSTVSTNLGGGSTYNTTTGEVSAPTYNVIGGSVTNVGAAITNIIMNGPVQYSDTAGNKTPLVPSNDVTLVGAAAGPVTMHNVAAGVAGTDAVNVSQLTAAKTKYYSVNSTGGGNVNNDGASALDAIASGKDALASAGKAVAMGTGATASNANSVAIGAGSSTDSVHSGTTAMYGGTANGIGSNTNGTFSVGALGAERQVQNVAAGVISSSSTDAINGSQLYTVTVGINKLGTTAAAGLGGGSTYDSSTGAVSAPTYNVIGGSVTNVGAAITNILMNSPVQYSDTAGKANPLVPTNDVTLVGANPALPVTIHNVAAGVAPTDAVNVSQLTASKTKYYSVSSTGGTNENNDGATALDAIAAGKNASASAARSISMGLGATSAAADSIAFGTGANAGNVNSVALGAGSTTASVHTGTTAMYGGTASGIGSDTFGTVSVGKLGAERQLQNVAAGVINATSTDAINGSQLYTVTVGVNKLGSTVAAGLGGGSTYDSTTGAVSAPSYQVIGSTATNVGDAITNIITMGPMQFSDAAGNKTPYTPSNHVTLVGVGGPVTIHNVAAGVAPTDAVNVSQLSTVASKLTKYYSVNDGGTAGGNVNNDGATAAGAIASGVGTSATAANATAIGSGATASNANSVALGAGSKTAAVNTGTTAMFGGTAAGAASATNGTVSVGSLGAERQVQNVAAGVISSTSTDAINGSQLYSVATGVNNLGASTAKGLGGGSTYDSATGTVSAPTYQVIGGSVTNVGDAITNILTNGPVQYSDATGKATPYTPSNDVTLVGTTPGADVRVHNVAQGVAGTDAVNVDQLNTAIGTVAKTKYYGVNSTGGSNEFGGGASGADAIASGKNASASGDNAVAIGFGATATNANSVALGAGSVTSKVNTGTTAMYGATAAGLGSDTFGTVSVGTAAAPRQVQNVAAGVINSTSTDAVNGSQLYSVTVGVNNVGTTAAAALGGGSTYNSTTGAISAPTYQVIGGTVNNVGAAITNIITQGPVQYSTPDGKATPYVPSNDVTLVGATAGPVTINNVAPAELSATSTEAVNGSQLYATNTYITAVDNKVNYVDARVTQVDNRVTNLDNRVTVLDNQNVKYDTNADGTTNYNSVTLGGGKTNSPVGLHNVADGVSPYDAVNKGQLDGLGKKLSGGVAAAAAMTVVTPVEAGRSHVGVSVAGFNGQVGLGFNWLKRSENGQTVGHASLGWGSGGAKAIVRFGIGFSYD